MEETNHIEGLFSHFYDMTENILTNTVPPPLCETFGRDATLFVGSLMIIQSKLLGERHIDESLFKFFLGTWFSLMYNTTIPELEDTVLHGYDEEFIERIKSQFTRIVKAVFLFRRIIDEPHTCVQLNLTTENRPIAVTNDETNRCVITLDPITPGMQYRMCSNTIAPHYYTQTAWEAWRMKDGCLCVRDKTQCVLNDGCDIINKIFIA